VKNNLKLKVKCYTLDHTYIFDNRIYVFPAVTDGNYCFLGYDAVQSDMFTYVLEERAAFIPEDNILHTNSA
jgi:hypothetical protein